MQQNKISVIVPCYNADSFIYDTLQSILSQKNADFELIVVNDGSTDNSETIIKSIADNRLRYYCQPNAGVSAARNFGLARSSGNFIMFFDSDDIMTDGFLESRLNCFQTGAYDFCGGNVQKFNLQGLINGFYRAPDHIAFFEEILFYNPQVITCPSNFMFRAEFLKKHYLQFNIHLSSTADRFFLLQCRNVGQAYYSEQLSSLNYRVNENSMSNVFSKGLVADNVLFYREIVKNGLIPSSIRRKVLFYGYYILSGSNYKVNNYYFALKYGIVAFLINPVAFFKKLIIK